MNGDKRFVSRACWVIPVVMAWFLFVVFTITIGVVDKYRILLFLPFLALVLLIYASYEYGKWYSSKD